MFSEKPIGIFDSGYGGLTIFNEIAKKLAGYDFIYLGDNARTPYGTRSFDVVYEYTLEAVKKLFNLGCNLIIIACNTSSAKALRNIQQKYLPSINSSKRVLGVIRPSVEALQKYTKTRHVGILATTGTVVSESYPLEIRKLFPDFTVVQEACPIWVPLVENNEFNTQGGEYFIRKHLDNLVNKDTQIDTIILGCTHYPILLDIIYRFLPSHIKIISQGEIVALSLIDYLQRHPEMERICSKNGKQFFYTTENAKTFRNRVGIFLNQDIKVLHISLG